jgi:hypothetical protein
MGNFSYLHNAEHTFPALQEQYDEWNSFPDGWGNSSLQPKKYLQVIPSLEDKVYCFLTRGWGRVEGGGRAGEGVESHERV